MNEPSERALTAATEWIARPGRSGDPQELALIIDRHMNPLTTIGAVRELNGIFNITFDNLAHSSETLFDKTIAIIERTGRRVSDV